MPLVILSFGLYFLLPTLAVLMWAFGWDWFLSRSCTPKEKYHQRWIASLNAALFGVGAYGALVYLIWNEDFGWSARIASITVPPAPAFAAFYYLLWNWKKYQLFCPHCGKYLPDTAEWVCGYCDTKSTRSFFQKCGHCRATPTAFACFHCGHIVPLVDPPDLAHIAQRPKPPLPPALPSSVAAQRASEKEEREHKLFLLKLDAELAQERGQLKRVRQQNRIKPRPSLEDDYGEHQEKHFRLHEIADREIAAAKAKYRDNTGLRERAIESIEEWRNRHI